MKVALISCHSFFHPGGVKKHILGLYKEYKKKNIETKIIIPRRNFSEDYGPDVILLGTSFPIDFVGGKADVVVNFDPIAIEETLRDEKFDVLHFHNLSFPSAVQFFTSPSTSNTLNILTFHSNIKGSNFLNRFKIVIDLINRICQWKIDGIIGVSPVALGAFKKYKGQKTIIPNGIDLEEFNPKVPKLKKFLDDKINILFVGRIEKRKGLIYLLRAFNILQKKFSNLRLIVVGEGELKKECQDYVTKNNLKEICFEGEKSGKVVTSYFNTCDIFCSPAIFGESFGIVLLEGMACGKPVVAFANQGYRELLGKTRGKRFLVSPQNYKKLAQKLESLIKNERLRKEMGQWGIEEVKKYAWPRVAERVLDFYQFCQQRKKKREEKRKLHVDKILSKFYNKNIGDLFK